MPRQIIQQRFQPGLSVAFDADAFDDLLAAHGVDLVHFRSMRNPAGMDDRFDSRRPGEDHVAASNGMVYTQAGCFVGAIIGNSKDLKTAVGGVLDASTAQLTAPRFYDTGAPVYLNIGDRIYLRETSMLVVHQQLGEVHATLVDRLKFPVVEVQDLMDADGTRYTPGTHFVVQDGNIAWLSPPPPAGDGARGKVYGIRYLYRPYWVVSRMVHDIRIAQTIDFSGQRVTQRMPQLAYVEREYVYRNEEQDPQAPNPNSPRQTAAPEDGGFGAR